jgi:hypothetical protein
MKFFTCNERVSVAYICCIELGRFHSYAGGNLMSDAYVWIIVQSMISVSCATYMQFCVKVLHG